MARRPPLVADEAIAATKQHFSRLKWGDADCTSLAVFYADLRGWRLEMPADRRKFRRENRDLHRAMGRLADACGMQRRRGEPQHGDLLLAGKSFGVCDQGTMLTFWLGGLMQLGADERDLFECVAWSTDHG